MTKSTGLIILELSTILSKINPNLILISADRFETLATGITAIMVLICHVIEQN